MTNAKSMVLAIVLVAMVSKTFTPVWAGVREDEGYLAARVAAAYRENPRRNGVTVPIGGFRRVDVNFGSLRCLADRSGSTVVGVCLGRAIAYLTPCNGRETPPVEVSLTWTVTHFGLMSVNDVAISLLTNLPDQGGCDGW